MATIKKIKRRIKSIESTQKITRAMKMVAATKLKRAQDRAESARLFFTETQDILQSLARVVEADSHPLFSSREGGNSCVVAITADRGLCGGYNSRIVKLVSDSLKDQGDVDLLVLGKRGHDIFQRQGGKIIKSIIDVPDYPPFSYAQEIAEYLVQGYLEGRYGKVFLAYTRFYTTLTQIPYLIPLLPIEKKEEEGPTSDFIMEPSPAEVIDLIVPRYLENLIYGAILEAKASEFGARMTAMEAATDSAQEMVDDLLVLYNRARQEEITLEMLEIVGGAEAIK